MDQVERTDQEKEIIKVIDKVRPYLQRDGGDLEYVKFEDGVVYVHILGACQGCMYIEDDLKDGVELILMEEVPGVTEVVAI